MYLCSTLYRNTGLGNGIMESSTCEPGLREDSDIQGCHAVINGPALYAPRNCSSLADRFIDSIQETSLQAHNTSPNANSEEDKRYPQVVIPDVQVWTFFHC